MTSPNSQGYNSLGNGPEDNRPDDPQSKQKSPRKHDLTTGFDPRRGQGSISDFEHYFTSVYSFQTSVLTNLNRLDWKNLQLAGVRTAVSREVQQKYLLPSKCDEKLKIPGSSPVACSNTTQTIREIKACHGQHEDGWVVQGRQLKWIMPSRLFKHVRDSNTNSLVQQSHENEGGYFDSFNVCIRCHDRDRQRRRAEENFTISEFHSTLCKRHSLDHLLNEQPYNICRCRMFLDQHWRCNKCSLETMDLLRLRAQAFFDDVLDPNCNWEEEIVYLDGTSGATQAQRECPISNCDDWPWLFAPERMLLCRVCTAIFPAPAQLFAI